MPRRFPLPTDSRFPEAIRALLVATSILATMSFAASCASDGDRGIGPDGPSVPGASGSAGTSAGEAPGDEGAAPDDPAAIPAAARERPDGTVWIARALEVVDGDSLKAEIDGDEVEIRLIGLNANEGGDCFGDEAGEFLAGLLGQDEFEVVSPSQDPRDRQWEDEFGRVLRYLYANGELVNYRLIVDGYAVARAQSEHPLERLFESAESEASDAKRGLWAADACGTPAASGIEIADFNANAPGPDDENRNGEWVELRNTSGADVEMGGWMVRDESTRHRYEFPDSFVLADGASVRLFSGAADEPLSDGYVGTALYWDDPAGSVWNNGGDTILVLDPSGNIVASERYSE